jgi:general secretion pathway protein A
MYLSFYHFAAEPFRLTPDPRFLHLAQPHRDALTGLIQGVAQRKGFVVLTGPIGTGKTTVLRASLELLTDQVFNGTPLASAFIVNPTLTREEFLEYLLEEFEIQCGSVSKPRRLIALQKMLLSTQKQGGTAVLIVDEAHLLSAELLEEIRLLSNADLDREKLLQVVLCGQPELLTLLQRPDLQALRQRVASWSLLRPLTLPETRVYIAERMHVAGLEGASPFSSAALEEIHRHGQGVPRLINLICDQCLRTGYTTQQEKIGVHIVEDAAGELALTTSTTGAAGLLPPGLAPLRNSTTWSTVDSLIETMKHSRATARE